ncbi:MAG TPA: LuxR C-terminal-related transcriptional regulator [Anaerolineaceae bacterium]|nr:LuxR C-terminal-related transcriptional regulator [Anaerolineaceae bacterium]
MTAPGPHDDPILRTKIQAPRLHPQRVARPRLENCLEEESWRKLALVSAPAGSGKTTLVAAWAAQAQHPCAWLTLDEGDNSLERFFRYLIAALQKIQPETGREAAMLLNAPQAVQPESFLGSLINDLEEGGSQISLVLDDFHAIHSPAVLSAVQYLVDHLPEGLHLVIASRSDPSLGLARLRASSELTELRGQDLRFSFEEASEFLSQVMGLSLTPGDIAALEDRTEGWIAGLQLAALSMRGREDTSRFVKVLTGSHRFILDYLVEEVLKQQPEEIKNFLLRTSILNRLCGELCEELIENREPSSENRQIENQRLSVLGSRFPTSSQALEYLESSNLFLIPLDTERTWYRYHTLFADLLRYRLEQEQPALVPDLHRRAAAWFAAKGFTQEAVQHFIAVQDWEEAAGLADRWCQVHLNEGQANQVLGWMDTLPAVLFDTNPRLHMMYGWALLSTSQFNRVGERIALARQAVQDGRREDFFRRLGGSTESFLRQTEATEAMIGVIQGNPLEGIQRIQAAYAALGAQDTMRASILTALGAIYRMLGQSEQARETFAQCVEAARANQMIAVALAAQGNVGDVLLEQGNLAEAEIAYRQLLDWGKRPDGSEYPVTCMGYIGLAAVGYMRNDLEPALEVIHLARRLAEQWGNFDMRMAVQIWLAMILLAQGKREDSLAAFAEMRKLAARHTGLSPNLLQMQGFDLQYSLDAGQLDAARDWLDSHPLAPGTPVFYLNELEILARISAVRALQEVDQYPTALELVDRLVAAVQAGGQFSRELPARIEKSLLLWATGQKEEALTAIQEALELGSARGFIRPFLTPGGEVRELLLELRSRGRSSAFQEKLMDLLSPAVEPQPSTTQMAVQPRQTSGPDALTGREVEVLRLVAIGLSNGQIAERLVLSEGTVKRHLHNIFSKLDAISRAQAIHRAREMGLL